MLASEILDNSPLTCPQEQKSRTNEISPLKVEAIQLVASLLCVYYIIVHYKDSSFGGIIDTLAYLPVSKYQRVGVVKQYKVVEI